MFRVALISLLLLACKGGSKEEPRETAPRTVEPPAPEPPGGPPSCGEVGAHLAAALKVPDKVTTTTNGAEVTMSGQAMHGAMRDGLVKACRDLAWTQETRACVLRWHGNILRERTKLAQACPGIEKS